MQTVRIVTVLLLAVVSCAAASYRGSQQQIVTWTQIHIVEMEQKGLAGPPAEARKNLRDADYEALAAKLLLHYGVERRVLEGISAGLAEVPQTADKRREMAVTIADRKARIVACCQYIARLNQ